MEADLIVMCTRGHSGIARWLMGSVTDRVLRRASVPVLVVQAAKEETRQETTPEVRSRRAELHGHPPTGEKHA